MAKVIMVQGTMSSAGKSFLVAGLCRIFKQDGYRVAPFKSQNMALNSYITSEGLEMGRAQVMQAEAAGITPMVCMNPILLKPTNNVGSQVIVNGEVLGNMSARDYFAYKKKLIPDIKRAFHKLEEYADIIVIEGAGSPAEINLKENDIVNMGMAQMVNAPVLLVGDIDRGGVFAQLLGTLMLLTDEEKARVKGLIINKFCGDKTILDPGIAMLEERGGVPVVGVVPYRQLSLEDEDSLTERFDKKTEGLIDIAVIRYPRISNFTDFNVFEQMPEVTVRYVTSVAELHHPDMICLPGSKNTMGDLKWMRQNGFEAAIKKAAETTPVFGICGGYQMLGMSIADPDNVEEGGAIRGMELLPLETILQKSKMRCQTEGLVDKVEGIFHGISGCEFQGYEIHMGETRYADCSVKDNAIVPFSSGDLKQEQSNIPFVKPESDLNPQPTNGWINTETDGSCNDSGKPVNKTVVQSEKYENVYGSYVHGIFDQAKIADAILHALAKKKGVALEEGGMLDYQVFKEKEYDKLADTLRAYLNMEEIYGMLREADLD